MRNKQTYDTIKNYIYDNNNQFSPKLSELVDIDKYARKLENLAEHFLLYNKNEEISAFAAVYFNDYNTNIAFLTYINVNKNEQGRGLGNKLLREIIEFAKNNKFKELKLEVSKSNLSAKSFYEKNKFKVTDENKTSFFMSKKIN
ncbi:MAG: GNAT family N-acetyltransferase [Bacteroidales bacterium]|nr:GNAT family N-acetyltransferase [Bacteroidales bacterium]